MRAFHTSRSGKHSPLEVQRCNFRALLEIVPLREGHPGLTGFLLVTQLAQSFRPLT